MIEKKIPIGDSYYARADGFIVSKKFGKTRVMAQSLNKQNGYYSVRLGYEINKYKTYYVHKLVMLAFVGDVPKDKEVRHFDGDKSNNSSSNLSYGTRLENHSDKIRHGTSGKGVKNSMAKLTDEEVLAIRKKYVNGKYGYVRLGKEFGVSPMNIKRIIKREMWQHI